VEARVRDVIVAHLGSDPAQVHARARLGADLGAGPLDLIELLIGLEQVFDTELLAAAPRQPSTVAELVDVVLNRVRLE